MERETVHFLEAVYRGGEVMVAPRLARQTMEVYVALDISVEKDQVIDLPLK